MRRRLRTPRLPAAFVALAAAALPAQAQDAAGAAQLQDGRWLPYLGCWVDVDAPVGPMTCVVPDGPGVAMLAVAGGEIEDRRILHADAGSRPVDFAGCAGSESVTFSSDGDRIYTRAELECGDAERGTRGLIAMVEADRWIEVRALDEAGEGSAWVNRYRPAPVTRVEAAGLVDRVPVMVSRTLASVRMAAASSISIDDLIEAQAHTHGAAVRAWLVEDGEPLRIDSDALIRLAEAEVDPSVIDVAVAVSFPDRFAVERKPRMDGRRLSTLDLYGYDHFGLRGMGGGLYGPYYYDPFYSRYDRYYGYGGVFGPSWVRYVPTRVVVIPTTGTSARGRVINGRGYTRGGSTGTAARPSVRSGPEASSGATATRGGHTGSSSGSKGKAKPRGGG